MSKYINHGNLQTNKISYSYKAITACNIKWLTKSCVPKSPKVCYKLAVTSLTFDHSHYSIHPFIPFFPDPF